jgi:hypothetical protein
MKATINSISENINFSNEEESDDEEDIDFLYISDDKSVFAFNHDLDDENEDKENNDNQ